VVDHYSVFYTHKVSNLHNTRTMLLNSNIELQFESSFPVNLPKVDTTLVCRRGLHMSSSVCTLQF
jgi:hypothetical protein